MKRIAALLLIVGVAVLAAAGPAVAGGDLKAAKAKAARSAAYYAGNHFGIYYIPSDWHAKCNWRGGGWTCKVGTDGGQCSGTLRIRKRGDRLDAYRKRIGCSE
jgi:hypothetical protein